MDILLVSKLEQEMGMGLDRKLVR
jgi:hypothetical protein